MSFTGTVWQNFTLSTANPPPPVVGVGGVTGSAQFVTESINYFTTLSRTCTTNQFFKFPTFFNLTGTFDPAIMISNTFTQFTGSVLLVAGNNSFVVSHDDGVVLDMPGIGPIPGSGRVVNAPGPTAMLSSPFNVVAPSTDFYTFTLYYNENNAGPAGVVWIINAITQLTFVVTT